MLHREGQCRAKAMKRLLLATAVLILAGCSDDPGTQLAACKMEAMRLWPNEDASGALRKEGAPRLRNHIDEYVPTCMEAHGYHENIAPADCDYRLEFHMQAACYETSTQEWFQKLWNRVKK